MPCGTIRFRSGPQHQLGYPSMIWYARWDSNPHCTEFEPAASCRLGYARIWYPRGDSNSQNPASKAGMLCQLHRSGISWCRWWESNPQPRRARLLKTLRIPFRHTGKMLVRVEGVEPSCRSHALSRRCVYHSATLALCLHEPQPVAIIPILTSVIDVVVRLDGTPVQAVPPIDRDVRVIPTRLDNVFLVPGDQARPTGKLFVDESVMFDEVAHGRHRSAPVHWNGLKLDVSSPPDSIYHCCGRKTHAVLIGDPVGFCEAYGHSQPVDHVIVWCDKDGRIAKRYWYKIVGWNPPSCCATGDNEG